MRAYRLRTHQRVAPFGDEARDLYVAARTLAEHQAAAARACGHALEDVEDLAAVQAPAILLRDDVYVSEMALRQFAAAAMSAAGDLELALPDEALARIVDPFDECPRTEDGGRRMGLHVLVDPAPVTAERLAAAAPWTLPSQGGTAEVALPPSIDAGLGARAEAPVTARVVGPARHWVHLLRLSHLAITVGLLDALRAAPRRILGMRWRRSRDPWAVARRLVFVHPEARVHPKADLEACVIGPGCVVEAHAHVHRSVLGPGVRVGDHAVVMGCTLAEGAQVLRASYLALCAAMPRATLASYKVQLSLFGRETFLTSSAWLIDAKLRGAVEVERDGRRHAVGPFLGCCLGHRVTLGAQVLVQAGRAIPNGQTIVGEPGKFLGRIQDLPEGTLSVIRNGGLSPLRDATGPVPDTGERMDGGRTND